MNWMFPSPSFDEVRFEVYCEECGGQMVRRPAPWSPFGAPTDPRLVSKDLPAEEPLAATYFTFYEHKENCSKRKKNE